MDEKGFLIGVVKKSMRVLIEAGEKAAFVWHPENRENITAIEAVGIFNQSIPPMVILKGENIFTDGIEERCQHIGLRQYLQMAGPTPY